MCNPASPVVTPNPALVSPSPATKQSSPSLDEAVIETLVNGYISMGDMDGDGALTVNTAETERNMGDRISSITTMAHVADRLGDSDGKASATEFRNLLTSFDRGEAGAGDGRLNPIELAAWHATGAYPVVRPLQ